MKPETISNGVEKPKSIAVLIPCYKRPEYTEECLNSVLKAQRYRNVHFYAVDDGSGDTTTEILSAAQVAFNESEQHIDSSFMVVVHEFNMGLRNTIIEFFETVLKNNYDIVSKIDNDCMVPDNWLHDLVQIMDDHEADIISPDVSETSAAYKYGVKDGDSPFLKSKIVGGVWTMRTSMIKDIFFEKIRSCKGIKAAFQLINQIVTMKSPKIGWTDKVTFEDVGYWAGTHQKHIKSRNHELYSAEVGRPIAWSPSDSTT